LQQPLDLADDVLLGDRVVVLPRAAGVLEPKMLFSQGKPMGLREAQCSFTNLLRRRLTVITAETQRVAEMIFAQIVGGWAASGRALPDDVSREAETAIKYAKQLETKIKEERMSR
jgi:hypothetical protein